MLLKHDIENWQNLLMIQKYVRYLQKEQLEIQKREIYNSDTLFTNKNKTANKDTALVEYTKEKWYKKIINKIINIFKRNKQV